jgi:hypothetical protein
MTIKFQFESFDSPAVSMLKLTAFDVDIHLVAYGGENPQYGLYVEMKDDGRGNVICMFDEYADLAAAVSLLMALANSEPVAASPPVQAIFQSLIDLQ